MLVWWDECNYEYGGINANCEYDRMIINCEQGRTKAS
jgi:hypothetical protein